ncbi:MAG: DUF1579 family protein [Anaerolineaceae bacterium]|nr:DUF1579 family protein [Anaerolineaceae bacterium]
MATTSISQKSNSVSQEQPARQPGQSQELEALAFFSGKWQGKGTFFATPWWPEKPIEMTTEVTRELGDAWYLTRTAEKASPENPQPLSAIYIWGYDAGSGRFVASWFDSRGGRATQTSSGWKHATLVFEGEMTAGGFTFPLRDTFEKRSEQAYHHIGEVSMEGRWMPVDEEDMTR